MIWFRLWWNGLSTWLKLVYAFVALPAWLFIMFCVATEQNKSIGAMAAFCVFAACAILHIIVASRNRQAGEAD